MKITEEEKKQHPQYREYVERYESALTGLEAGLRGAGDPALIVEKCLNMARSFYDADSAALVETNLELGYGVCIMDDSIDGLPNFKGKIINITPEETPFLYARVMRNEVFEIDDLEKLKEVSPAEAFLLNKMDTHILAVAPYYKRSSGYLYIRNPKRFVGLYGMLQALSYIFAAERNEFQLMDSLNIAVSSKGCRSNKDVFIKVFGGLSITTKFGTLSESEITSSLAIRLVAYLLLNDTRKVSQRELTEALWPDAEVDSPAKQVRNVVHRTRNILNPIFPDSLVVNDKMGNYYINPNVNIVTDASVFESYIRNGQRPSATQKEKIHYLKQAVEIYQHEFLPNMTGDSWLDNQRTFYHLTYLQAVIALLPLLYKEEAYSDMYALSSAALLYEPENGDILFWHIRAMIELGGLEIAQRNLTQHSQSLNEDQKDILSGILNTLH
ncbi:MAG: BTAD domain-containing putative transcriptional regulator [Lachnospiraceae bacterium]|nr:BTAD domain-containing putative transcriptional regulator [Lachnospiraceae bacterium]